MLNDIFITKIKVMFLLPQLITLLLKRKMINVALHLRSAT